MLVLRRWYAPCLVAAIAFAVQVARLLTDGYGNPFDHVFAEDGSVFLADAQRLGWPSLGHGFAGYGHLVPRLVGLVGSALPLRAYAAFAALAAVTVVGICAGLVFLAARRVVEPGWALAAALLVVLVPGLNEESLGVVANVQWFLMPAAAWFLVDDGERSPWTARVVVLAALSTAPLTVLVTPLLFVHGRRGLRHPAVPALVAGALGQAAYLLLAPMTPGGPDRHPGVPANLVRVAADFTVHREGRLQPFAVAIAYALVVLATALVAWVRTRLPVLMLAVAVLIGLVPTVLTGILSARYVGAATTFLLTAALLAGRERPDPPLLTRAGAAVLVLAVAVGFPAAKRRVLGPSWPVAVSDARADCRATGRATIPVAPATRTPPAELRC